MREPELDPVKPLAAASARLNPVKPRGKVDPNLVIGMKAAGVSQKSIANALQVREETITKTLDRVDGAREQIQDLREKLRHLKIVRAHQVAPRTWDRFEREVAKGSAKDVDAMARALSALEKVEASASGEGQRVHLEGNLPATTVDLKVLIGQLLDR